MIKTEPKHLLAEIQAAERLRDKHMSKMREIVKIFAGSAFRKDWSGPDWKENHFYEYVALTLPSIIFNNPRCRISTRRPATQAQTAKAIEYGLNRWAYETDYRETGIRVATDMLMGFGVDVTLPGEEGEREPDRRNRSNVRWPRVKRLSPYRFIIDPACLYHGEARYMGYKWVRDREDILREAEEDEDSGWNVKLVRDIAENAGVADLHRTEDARNLDRDEIVGWDLWIPEIDLDDSPGPEKGFHGTWYTVVQTVDGGGTDDYVREPRAFYGPPWGPFSMKGVYVVPDCPYPLSPLMAAYSQVEELNQHVSAMSRSARNYKKIVLVNSKKPDLSEKITNSPDSFVVLVDGLDPDDVVQIELGGITAQQVEMVDRLRERVDRISGINDAQRGSFENDPTATEVTIATESSSLRLAYVQNQFSRGVQRNFETVGWYMYNDEEIEFPLGEDAAEEFGMAEPGFKGGKSPEDGEGSYDDLDIEIDPYSMEKMNEGLIQQRVMQMMELTATIAPLVPQTPYVKWDELFKKVGDAMNMPDMTEMIDMNMAQQMMAMQMAAQQEEQQASQAEEAPNRNRVPGRRSGAQAAERTR